MGDLTAYIDYIIGHYRIKPSTTIRKKVGLRLSSANPRTLLAYLLIICDEIQEWERERVDVDAELPEALLSKKGAVRETKLIGISFKPNYAYVVLGHK